MVHNTFPAVSTSIDTGCMDGEEGKAASGTPGDMREATSRGAYSNRLGKRYDEILNTSVDKGHSNVAYQGTNHF